MGVSYADAARLLGEPDSRIVAALDHLTGGLLLAATAAGSGFALSLFAARDEVVRLSSELLAGLEGRLRGLDRFSRSERLAAAHAIVVLVAYFDSLADAELPFAARDLELKKSEQVALAGAEVASGRLRDLAEALLRSEVPMPTPERPYEATVQVLRGYYARLSDQLLQYVSGLAVYERLDETRRERFAETVSQSVPYRAVARYEESFRQLAVDFPEFAFWANLVDQQATREQFRQLRTGLQGLELALSGMVSGRAPDERRAALWRAYQAPLTRPVLATRVAPEGLTVPLLGRAYVNPDFRVAANSLAEHLGEESTWADEPVRNDLAGFLAGYLTSPGATKAPLIVLGQPGSGKSVLTQMMAARLPADQFLVVRVVLRDVAADEEVQTQIEHGVHTVTGESLAWPDLARTAGDALPVVLLDGFDELLQATGVSQADYLKKVAEFQDREATQGRPVAVVVTSRIAVADRALPAAGMVVIRLEPFREAQVGEWLQMWNQANAEGFARRGLQPLPLHAVLAHAELAAQPLLLTMLAVFDADGNDLQNLGEALKTSDLYDRLLTRFAEREVDRTGAPLTLDQLDHAVEHELLRLSLAAFAMFNRGRQWITEAELDLDLAALFSQPGSLSRATTLRAPLSVAQITLGRFFFIYEAQATRDKARLRTYEFLHATFGEYLVARLVAQELGDLARTARPAVTRRAAPPDDAFLYALLSFMPLTTRGTVISFLAERLEALPGDHRKILQSALLELFYDALSPRHDTRYSDYLPLELHVPARYAAYTANLVLMIVLAGGPVTCSSLFPHSRDAALEWRNLALLWRSQLRTEGWSGLVNTIAVERIWDHNRRELLLRAGREPGYPPQRYDPFWGVANGPDDEKRVRGSGSFSNWVHLDYEDMRSQAHFTADMQDDVSIHALEPFAEHLGTAITTFHSYWYDRSVSAANALITLWLTSSLDSSPDELAAAYDTCLKISVSGFAPYDTQTRRLFRTIFLRQVSSDYDRLPRRWLELAAQAIMKGSKEDQYGHDGAALLRMANEILPALMVL